MVDSLAADLIYFTGSMPIPRFCVTQVGFILGGIAAAVLLVAISPAARAAVHTASGVPPPPPPTHAYIVLDTAAGGPRTRITVSGSSFPPSASVSLYWDTPSQVAGSTAADSGGSFTTSVIPFPGSTPGVHKLCGSAAGLNQAPPCANFTLQGSPTPTPSSSASPSASPLETPSPTPSASPLVLAVNSGHGGLDVITRPPLVFLPIIALLALVAALAYWVLMRVDRTPVLPSASVVHRSARPEVGPLPGRRPESSPAAAAPTPPAPAMQPPPPDLPPPLTPLEAEEDDDGGGSGPSGAPEPPPY